MRLSATEPLNDPVGLWSLQLELMSTAEAVLGPRDSSKRIYQPQFTDNGPLLRNTPAMDGAYVELSRAGQSYWPTVAFEMAHETVHLLNPVAGDANNLEEGVAVAFFVTYSTVVRDPHTDFNAVVHSHSAARPCTTGRSPRSSKTRSPTSRSPERSHCVLTVKTVPSRPLRYLGGTSRTVHQESILKPTYRPPQSCPAIKRIRFCLNIDDDYGSVADRHG